MTRPDPRITACILARNEERRLLPALESLRGWTDYVLVLDNESEDGTAALARQHADQVLTVPRPLGGQFDALRNRAREQGVGDWIFFLDADERVPPRLGLTLKRLVQEEGEQFEALVLPFQHHFCGEWIRHSGWWPGYTRPQLLRRDRFQYNERLHSGVEVDGRIRVFPADDPELAIVHYSYENLHHYLEKLNRYTDGEAESLVADGRNHSWQAQLAHFVHDWQVYYERGHGDQDGMHGFVLAFMSAFYRFASRAKAWDLRRQREELNGPEPVPADLREMLEFMARVAQEGAQPWLDQTIEAPNNGSNRNRVTSRAPVPLLWHGPLLDPSGYADEARQFVLGLAEAGEEFALAPARWGEEEAGVSPELQELVNCRSVPLETPCELFVSHTLPALQAPSPQARINIARTMFETDRLPDEWVARLNRMDRVWVPTEFNRETFLRSGVEAERLAVVPAALEAEPFLHPGEPWPLPGAERFRFLSVFDWTLHKGWDVLLEAFAQEFGDDPEVGLVVKTWSTNGYSFAAIREQADALLQERLGRSLAEFPNIHLWQEHLPVADLPRLYAAVNAFVLPTRGEGWCRPLMEAMATGLPTVATAWSGLTAFHDAEVGYLLPYRLMPVSAAGARELPIYQGHCWAEPDLPALRRLLRRIVAQPEEAQARGRAAQARIRERYSRAAVTQRVQEELAECRRLVSAAPIAPARSASLLPTLRDSAPPSTAPSQRAASTPPPGMPHRPFLPAAAPIVREPAPPVRFRELLGRPLRVRWEGDQTFLSSLALVNREFCHALLEAGDVELSLGWPDRPWPQLTATDDPRFGPLFARRDALLSGPPDVTIRHHFPPNWERPTAGKLIVIQPWEYGHLPRDWVAGATAHADEIWAYSRFVRDVYARSGVPAERVRVLPLGFNPTVFSPEGPVSPLATAKGTQFLFVGGALDRKGADLLLDAYRRAFSRADDVCLIVKDMGTRSFYQDQTFADAFRRAQQDPTAPEILYREDDLSDGELAALYRSATCLVLPYRGEGFALPPLEAMACGIPVIVTAGGPTDDYVGESCGWRLPVRRRQQGAHQVGPFRCVGDPHLLEPEPEALIAALREVSRQPDLVRERGAAARQAVAERWTWQAAAGELRERLASLVAPQPKPSEVRATPWHDSPLATDPGKQASPQNEEPLADPDAVSRGKPVRAPGTPAGKGGQRKKSNTSSATIGSTPVSPKEASPGANVSPFLSLCMIVRDEEPRLASCLQSIAPYVDEIVVVDTGSTDRTREVARDCGARVFEMPWPDSFAAARNQSLALARGEWLFWMDADDVIAPECGPELRELAQSRPQRDAAFQVQVRIPPGPGEFHTAVVDHVKLFPNRPDLRFEHRIHEQILPAIRRAGLEVCFSDLFVTHQNYDRSDSGQARKRHRDFRLLELDLQDHPDHPFILFNLGMTHLYATRDYEVAAHYLRRSLERSDPSDSIVRKAYAMLATAHSCTFDREAALRANEAGRRHYPEDAELLFQAGQLYQEVNRFAEARQALERLVTGQDDLHYRSVDLGLRGHRGQHELALLYRRLGDPAHCEQVLRRIATEHPSYLPAHQDLADTFELLGKEEDARNLRATFPGSVLPPPQRQNGTASPSLAAMPRGTSSSSGIAWERAPQFGRRSSILGALRRLHALHPGPVTIIETGTTRNADPAGCWGDGWSTVAWGWYVSQVGGRVYTVDLDPACLEVCRHVTTPYSAVIEYVAADSVQFLRDWTQRDRGPIHLLYPDSVDHLPWQGDPGSSEEHNLREVQAALASLASPGILLIDDTGVLAGGPDSADWQEPPGTHLATRFEGKGARSIPWLREQGWVVAACECRQVLLTQGRVDGERQSGSAAQREQ